MELCQKSYAWNMAISKEKGRVMRMGQSKVTEYMINYLKENGISGEEVCRQVKIAPEKLKKDYNEPLLADEFLRLCVHLKLSPEKISKDIKT